MTRSAAETSVSAYCGTAMQVSPAALAAATPRPNPRAPGHPPAPRPAVRRQGGRGPARASMRDVVGGHDHVEDLEHAGGGRAASTRRRGEFEASPSGARPRNRATSSIAPGRSVTSRSSSAYIICDHLVDELRPARRGSPRRSAKKSRGYSNEVPITAILSSWLKTAPCAAKSSLLGALPEHFGVQQQAVHVEDDSPIPMPQAARSPLAEKNDLPRSARERRSGTADTAHRARAAGRPASAPRREAPLLAPLPAGRWASWSPGAWRCRWPRDGPSRPRPRMRPRSRSWRGSGRGSHRRSSASVAGPASPSFPTRGCPGRCAHHRPRRRRSRPRLAAQPAGI